MLKVNFSSYGTYKTDCLYQWDIDRTLYITGLDLKVIPEIHFSNAYMDKAIVRQATLSNGAITVKIPNSVLQKPLRIDIHVGIYEGSEFKVIEKIEIPVIPRERPEDYSIEDTDEEIYSFKSLENALANKADNARVDNILADGTAVQGYEVVVKIIETTAVNAQVNLYPDDIEINPGLLYFDVLNNEWDIINAYYKNASDINSNSVPWIRAGWWLVHPGMISVHQFDEAPIELGTNLAVKIVFMRKTDTLTELKDIRVGADGNTYDSAGTAVREQFKKLTNDLGSHFNNDKLNDEIINSILPSKVWSTVIIGSELHIQQSVTSRACTPIYKHWKDIEISITDGFSASIILFDDNNICLSETGWITGTRKIKGGQNFGLNLRRKDETEFSDYDLTNIITINIIEENNTEDVIDSIDYEFNRKNGASYVFVRIPYTSNNGNDIRPRLTLTSADNGIKKSALSFAKVNNSAFVINGGLFNVNNVEPVGQTIIDGNIYVRDPMLDDNGVAISDTECYPLCIDENGILSAPYTRDVDIETMLNDGVKYSVVGWGKLVDNFEICSDDIEAEIVHPGTYIRQCIGQFQNGDYCVLTVDQSRGSVENEAGLTYEECAQILVDKGVKFAYSLDGGGSAETVIGKRQLNPIYEGETGRAVPTVITFEID